jgi:hypothetical protein
MNLKIITVDLLTFYQNDQLLDHEYFFTIIVKVFLRITKKDFILHDNRKIAKFVENKAKAIF